MCQELRKIIKPVLLVLDFCAKTLGTEKAYMMLSIRHQFVGSEMYSFCFEKILTDEVKTILGQKLDEHSGTWGEKERQDGYKKLLSAFPSNQCKDKDGSGCIMWYLTYENVPYTP